MRFYNNNNPMQYDIQQMPMFNQQINQNMNQYMNRGMKTDDNRQNNIQTQPELIQQKINKREEYDGFKEVKQKGNQV